MKAKLVKESLSPSSELPEDVTNILLDIGLQVQNILGLDISPLSDIKYNNRFHAYEAIIPNVADNLRINDMHVVREMLSDYFPDYQESIDIKYDRNINGIKILLYA